MYKNTAAQNLSSCPKARCPSDSTRGCFHTLKILLQSYIALKSRTYILQYHLQLTLQ